MDSNLSNYEIDEKYFETTYDVLNVTYTLNLRLVIIDYGTSRKFHRKFYDWYLSTNQILLDDNHIFKSICRQCCELSDDAKSIILTEVTEFNDDTTDLFELIMMSDQELTECYNEVISYAKKQGLQPKEMSINDYRSFLINEINNLSD